METSLPDGLFCSDTPFTSNTAQTPSESPRDDITYDQPIGPVQEWAYYYKPPLTIAQADYVCKRMKSMNEYRQMDPEKRYYIMIRDLTQALESMRQFYNSTAKFNPKKSSDTPGRSTPSKTRTATSSLPTQLEGSQTSKRRPVIKYTLDGHAVIGMEEPISNTEMDYNVPIDLAAPPPPSAPNSSQRQRDDHEPDHNLGDNHVHRKRMASDDFSKGKRQKISSEDEKNVDYVSDTFISEDSSQDFGEELALSIETREKDQSLEELDKTHHKPTPDPIQEKSDDLMETMSTSEASSTTHTSKESLAAREIEYRHDDKDLTKPSVSPADVDSILSGSMTINVISPPTKNEDANKRKTVFRWVEQEVNILLDCRAQGKTWDEIAQYLPRHSKIAIQRRYSEIPSHVKENLNTRVVKTSNQQFPPRTPAMASASKSPPPMGTQSIQQSQRVSKKVYNKLGFKVDMEGRAYDMITNNHGITSRVHGLLLPGNYKDLIPVGTGLPWVCPIRSCRYAFRRVTSLGKHWKKSHRTCLLNDNNDGTFSIKGKKHDKRSRKRSATAIVISQGPLDPHELPMVDIKGFRQMQLDKLAKKDTRGIVLREASNRGQNGGQNTDTFTAGNPRQIENSLSPSLPERGSSPGQSLTRTRTRPVDKNEDDALGSPHFDDHITGENWGFIQSLFSSKKFLPPESGAPRNLLSLPRKREIHIENTIQQQKFSVLWPKDVSMLINQLVGEESKEPCSRCAGGRGIFTGCVMISQGIADLHQNGVVCCVNCGWKSAYHRTCSLRQPRNGGDKDGGQPAEAHDPLAQTETKHPEQDSDEDGIRPLRSRRSGRLMESGGQPEVRSGPRNHSSVSGRAGDPHEGPSQAPRAGNVETAILPGAEETSTTRLASWQSSHMDGNFTFRIGVLPSGTTLQLEPDYDTHRICSLAVGKVTVKIQGEPAFKIGSRGMFKLGPGIAGEVVNTSGLDAVLHVSSLGGRR